MNAVLNMIITILLVICSYFCKEIYTEKMTSTKLQPIFSILRFSILDFLLSAVFVYLAFFYTAILLFILAMRPH